MEKIEQTMTFKKETRRKYAYEDANGFGAVDSVYIEKRDVGQTAPKAIKITIEQA